MVLEGLTGVRIPDSVDVDHASHGVQLSQHLKLHWQGRRAQRHLSGGNGDPLRLGELTVQMRVGDTTLHQDVLHRFRRGVRRVLERHDLVRLVVRHGDVASVAEGGLVAEVILRGVEVLDAALPGGPAGRRVRRGTRLLGV